MKKGILIFLTLISINIEVSPQAYPNQAWTVKSVWINFHAANSNLEENDGLFQNLTPAFEFGFAWNFKEWFSIDVPLTLGTARFPIVSETNDSILGYKLNNFYGGLDILPTIHFWKSKKWSPFIYSGIGLVMEGSSEFYTQSPIGLGLCLKLSKSTSLTGQTDYRISLKDGYNNIQHAIGIRSLLNYRPKDLDRDGIPDKDDHCPEVYGTVAGCPDTDSDGIADFEDLCIHLAGVSENNGCPADSDKDGVYDIEDICPTIAGSVKGCPDKDRDGVADQDDHCIDLAGPLITNGCPDIDKDGIPDQEDRCPEEAGILLNHGCPDLKTLNQNTNNSGYLAIQFKTGSSVIDSVGYDILNEVYYMLIRFPEMRLSVQGHTDNTGEELKNQNLSNQRVKICMDYLINKGIALDRMFFKAYGKSQPIGDNTTAEGRQMNRRTEFIPVWR